MHEQSYPHRWASHTLRTTTTHGWQQTSERLRYVSGSHDTTHWHSCPLNIYTSRIISPMNVKQVGRSSALLKTSLDPDFLIQLSNMFKLIFEDSIIGPRAIMKVENKKNSGIASLAGQRPCPTLSTCLCLMLVKSSLIVLML